MKPALWPLLFLVAGAQAQQPPTFMAGVEAYEAGDYRRCADTLWAMQAAAAPMATNGELLVVECLARADRFEDAFAYLRRHVPSGGIGLDGLRDTSAPWLDDLRRQPAWNAFLKDAEAAESQRLSRIDAPLRDELLRRSARDQQARSAALARAPGGEIDPQRWQAVQALDRENTAWLRAVVEAKGWPDSTLVGIDGAKAAWLLVQHADHDAAFQSHALALMELALAKGTVERADVALLTDRVLRAQGQPQRYGTQFETREDGVMRMQPVEDAAGLDARRAAMNLPGMAEYRKLLSEGYGRPVE